MNATIAASPRPTPRNPTPRKVLLFSGHMIDAPDRDTPRFPADKEPVAARAIAQALDDIGVNGIDLAICSGACGGDLLFAEAALARGMSLEIFIPFDEPTFLMKSVDFADAQWRARYFAAKSHARTTLRIMPAVLGPLPEGADPYERNNLWMLESAIRFGAEKVDFICLWNGQGGDRSRRHAAHDERGRARIRASALARYEEALNCPNHDSI